jgi:hypothetical protein
MKDKLILIEDKDKVQRQSKLFIFVYRIVLYANETPPIQLAQRYILAGRDVLNRESVVVESSPLQDKNTQH